MFNFLKRFLPNRRELSPEESSSLDSLYGTDGWKALEAHFENRRADLNDELLSLWYSAKADPASLSAVSVASVALVSRMRELEDQMQGFRDKYQVTEQKPIISQPKTIDQYL